MNKFSNRQFFLFGINYIVGFGFITTIGTLISSRSYGFLIFGVASFIGLVVALVFSKLSNKYPNTVGGSYAYSKYAFGKKMTFLQGWNQFLKGPVTSALTPLFLASIMSAFDDDKSHEIYYILTSIVIFSILNLVATFGIKTNKYVIFATAFIKWSVMFGAVILLAYNVIYGITQSTITVSAFESGSISKISLLFGSIIAFVYAFGGLETLGTVSRDANVKNWRKLIMIVFLLILSFYFVVYLLFIFVPGLAPTADSNAFRNLYETTLGLTGLILFGIGIFFNRISAISSSVYSSSREIVALAEDDYFPVFFAKKNKHGEYRNTIVLAAIINISSMFFFAILPTFIFSQSTVDAIFLNSVVNGVLFFLNQYFLTLVTAIVLKYKKQIKINFFEELLYYLGIIVILIVMIGTMVPVVFNIFPLSDGLVETWTVENTVLISAFFGFNALGFVVWYINSVFSKKRQRKEEMKINIEEFSFNIPTTKELPGAMSSKNEQKPSLLVDTETETYSKIELFNPLVKPKIKNKNN